MPHRSQPAQSWPPSHCRMHFAVNRIHTKVYHNGHNLQNKQTGWWEAQTPQSMLCYGNRLVIDNRGGYWTFMKFGNKNLSSASLKITLTKRPPKQYLETEGQNIGSSLQKHTQVADLIDFDHKGPSQIKDIKRHMT